MNVFQSNKSTRWQAAARRVAGLVERQRPPRMNVSALVAGGLLAGGAAAYVFGLRPRLMRWGATPEEVRATLPGDDLIPTPEAVSTRAITIDASPDHIWPLIVDLGQRRRGFYSYGWIERLAGVDADAALDPDGHPLDVGDTVRLAASDRFPDAPELVVAALTPGKALVLRTPTGHDEATRSPDLSWACILQPTKAGPTRLIVRTRSNAGAGAQGRLVHVLTRGSAQFLMEQAMLRGIKNMAEGAARAAGEEARAADPATRGQKEKISG